MIFTGGFYILMSLIITVFLIGVYLENRWQKRHAEHEQVAVDSTGGVCTALPRRIPAKREQTAELDRFRDELRAINRSMDRCSAAKLTILDDYITEQNEPIKIAIRAAIDQAEAEMRDLRIREQKLTAVLESISDQWRN